MILIVVLLLTTDDPTFSIKDELQGKRGRGRPRSLREVMLVAILSCAGYLL